MWDSIIPTTMHKFSIVFVFGLNLLNVSCAKSQGTDAVCDGDEVFEDMTRNQENFTTLEFGVKQGDSCEDVLIVKGFPSTEEFQYIGSDGSIVTTFSTYDVAVNSSELIVKSTDLDSLLRNTTNTFYWVSNLLRCDSFKRTSYASSEGCFNCIEKCCTEEGKNLAVKLIRVQRDRSATCPYSTTRGIPKVGRNDTLNSTDQTTTEVTKTPYVPSKGSKALWIAIIVGSVFILILATIVICKVCNCCTTTVYEEVPYAEPSDVIGSSSAAEYSTPFDARQAKSGVVKIKTRQKSKKLSRKTRLSFKFRTGSKKKTLEKIEPKTEDESGYSDIKFDGSNVTIDRKEKLKTENEFGYAEVGIIEANSSINRVPIFKCLPDKRTAELDVSPYAGVEGEEKCNVTISTECAKEGDKGRRIGHTEAAQTDPPKTKDTTQVGKKSTDVDSNPYDVVIPLS